VVATGSVDLDLLDGALQQRNAVVLSAQELRTEVLLVALVALHLGHRALRVEMLVKMHAAALLLALWALALLLRAALLQVLLHGSLGVLLVTPAPVGAWPVSALALVLQVVVELIVLEQGLAAHHLVGAPELELVEHDPVQLVDAPGLARELLAAVLLLALHARLLGALEANDVLAVLALDWLDNNELANWTY